MLEVHVFISYFSFFFCFRFSSFSSTLFLGELKCDSLTFLVRKFRYLRFQIMSTVAKQSLEEKLEELLKERQESEVGTFCGYGLVSWDVISSTFFVIFALFALFIFYPSSIFWFSFCFCSLFKSKKVKGNYEI